VRDRLTLNPSSNNKSKGSGGPKRFNLWRVSSSRKTIRPIPRKSSSNKPLLNKKTVKMQGKLDRIRIWPSIVGNVSEK